MNSILNVVRRFLVRHSVWMHFTIIFILAYLMIQLSHFIYPKTYGLWALGMFLFSIPALAFVVFRDVKKLKRNFKYALAWSAIFLVYPLLLFVLKIDIISLPFAYQLTNFDIDGAYTFTTLSILFLVLEVVLYGIDRMPKQSMNLQGFGKLSVLKLSIIIVVVMCLFFLMANNYFSELTDGSSLFEKFGLFIYYFFQLFIIYISYYLYYYLHHHFLYKVILKERGLIAYFMGLGLVMILITPLQNFFIALLPVVHDLKLHPTAFAGLYEDFNFSLSLLVLIISFPMIVIIEWYKQSNAIAILEQQKSKAELSLLKQQINPHFFFNTLNNLYAMSLDEDKETPETILQLSEMMRYVIYKGKEEKVKLKDEANYMQDYIDLQMIRVHKTVDLKVDFDVKNEDLEISPLLFVILLENAFKHGIEPAGHSSTLYVSLKENFGEIIFECYNSKPEDGYFESNGIGLENLKKRLQIIYPNRHQLLIDDSENYYKVTLKITL